MARIRIYKTYEDAASYGTQSDQIVFERPLGIRRNVIVLLAGYELIASSVPSIVSTQPDGRMRISMLNDRDDQVPVKIIGRKYTGIAAGESVRVRVVETYTDPVGYRSENGELVWDRTLRRPYNDVALPAGWMLTSVSVPAIVSLDPEGRVVCRFTNARNDEIHVVLKARRRKSN